MKAMGMLFGAALLLTGGSAFADCMSATQAYSYGYQVGGTTCDNAQETYANQVVNRSPGFPGGDTICDTTAILNCKAGFKAGYDAGGAQYIAGIYVPSCKSLRSGSYGGDYSSTYATVQTGTCNSH